MSRLTRTGVLILGLMLGFASSASSQTVPASGTGVLTADAPVFLFPDVTRTPLTTLKSGTAVNIRGRQGDWYRIEFRDPRFGDRTGYVAAANIRVRPTDAGGRKASPPSPSASQPTRRAPQRGRIQKPRQPVVVSLNGGVQTTSRGFSTTSTIRRFEEDGTLTSAYSGDRPIVYDLSVDGGVGNGWSAGLAFTYASKPLVGEVTAEIPHPLFFDKSRTVSGTTTDMKREEIAVHINAGWTVPAGRSTRVMVFAGPSYFRLTQDLVTELEAAEEYPYDGASFVSATQAEATKAGWGFNAGFDVSQRLSKNFGIGAVARYSRASFTLPIAVTQGVDVKAGGVQVSAGVRLQF